MHKYIKNLWVQNDTAWHARKIKLTEFKLPMTFNDRK